MFVVLLNEARLVAVKRNWIEYPIVHSISKIFFSPFEDSKVDFNLPVLQTFSPEQPNCYLGFICKRFGEHTHTFIFYFSWILIIIEIFFLIVESERDAKSYVDSKQQLPITNFIVNARALPTDPNDYDDSANMHTSDSDELQIESNTSSVALISSNQNDPKTNTQVSIQKRKLL